jgi:protein CpxP
MPDAIDRLARPAAVRRLAGAAAMLLLGLAATGASAQGPAEFQLAQASQKQGAPQRQAQPAQPPANPIDSQIADLQKRLKITDAQKPQFDAFVQVVRQNAQTMEALVQQEQKAAHNAVDDLRSSVKIAQEEADGLKRLLPPMEALYASLSDQQKRTADQLLGSQQTQAPPQQQQQQRRKQG